MNERVRHVGASTAALVGLLASSAAVAIPPEVWVVNEASQDVSIIDDIADDPSTIDVIVLATPEDFDPYGIAFSTLPADPGGFAFVSQGPDIRVIDATSRAVTTVDIAGALGLPRGAVTLKGLDAARPDAWDDGSGATVLRSFVHAAALLDPPGAEPPQPWFLVLDQLVLVGGGPPGASPIVADGPLAPQPAPAGLDPMEVRVLGSPAGPHVQRAWYTYRRLGAAPSLTAALVRSNDIEAASWSVARRVARAFGGSDLLLDSMHPGAPHSRELPLLPDGPSGDLLDLGTGNVCVFGAIDANVRATAVTGPGLGSFDVWTVVDPRDSPTDPLDPGMLHRTKWDACDVIDPPVPLGLNPTDIDTRGRVDWQEVYVSNHGSDSVTVVTDGVPLPTTIRLHAGGGNPCVKCPRSLAVRERPATICRAVGLHSELVSGKTEERLSWRELGCDSLVRFTVWCKCLSPSLNDCSSQCVANCVVPPVDTGEIWCEVDTVDTDNEITTPEDGNGGDEKKNIEPKDDE
jgi:hypothetical protein